MQLEREHEPVCLRTFLSRVGSDVNGQALGLVWLFSASVVLKLGNFAICLGKHHSAEFEGMLIFLLQCI